MSEKCQAPEKGPAVFAKGLLGVVVLAEEYNCGDLKEGMAGTCFQAANKLGNRAKLQFLEAVYTIGRIRYPTGDDAILPTRD